MSGLQTWKKHTDRTRIGQGNTHDQYANARTRQRRRSLKITLTSNEHPMGLCEATRHSEANEPIWHMACGITPNCARAAEHRKDHGADWRRRALLLRIATPRITSGSNCGRCAAAGAAPPPQLDFSPAAGDQLGVSPPANGLVGPDSRVAAPSCCAMPAARSASATSTASSPASAAG